MAAIGVMAASQVAQAADPAAAAVAASEPVNAKEGSFYLQCDGAPNNMTGGESAARLLGAVTLLALFAPPPEGFDASKRKFGADGVAACSALLSGDKQEGNPARRVGLMLGRALHQIEATDYQAAIADVGKARAEAEAAGLMADPYYVRSRGRAFALIEAAALARMGRAAEARELALRDEALWKHAYFELATRPNYDFAIPTGSAAEDRDMDWRSRAEATFAVRHANRLDELGRFAEAAVMRDALVDFDRATTPDARRSVWIAQAVVSHALAGDGVKAAELAREARANFDKRQGEGKPEPSAAEYVELMDLYAVIQAADAGDVKAARRLFSARSQWVGASFGSVLEMNRRLRAGAAPDELIGGLARDPEQLWKDRADTRMATMLAADKENKALFWLIPSTLTAGAYEALSKQVWRVDKSRILIKPKDPSKKKSALETLALYGSDASVTFEALSLHAALLAQSRGHEGFVIMPVITERVIAAGILTGKRGDPGLPAALFNDAAAVIAELRQILPDPEALKARRAAKAS
ncbi:MAG: hypothetical protein ABS87_15080 [Sphingomonas sp. SCN 67-18]|uniref:hypothetical protein n=1 Tax=uncultured Sphingomonas sp. TaxID=158754 RepID=UPI00086F22F1|nr:hypothetical protein [uncultured Sphingomonas sp.]ODU17155.1 MAG: hypothetical protein ABS87_15080 [Sphingomonas sp. SCN 67-18]